MYCVSAKDIQTIVNKSHIIFFVSSFKNAIKVMKINQNLLVILINESLPTLHTDPQA